MTPHRPAKLKPIIMKTRQAPSVTQKRKLYRIIWRDAFSEEDKWHDESTLETGDYICETIGFLIETPNRPDYITIASTITQDGYFCSVINIPKAFIISKTRLQTKGFE
jgi:hypothetical protein